MFSRSMQEPGMGSRNAFHTGHEWKSPVTPHNISGSLGKAPLIQGRGHAVIDREATPSYVSNEDKMGVTSLFEMFYDAMASLYSPEQLYDLISNFVQNCDDVLDTANQDCDDKTAFSWLENERNTWRLIYALYIHRLNSVEAEQIVDVKSEAKVVDNFFLRDKSVCEIQLVIDWLEENAAKRKLQGDDVLQHGDKTIHWENTLYQLQNEQVPYPSSKQLVTEIDPDAPVRMKSGIHDLDAEDESRMLEQMFREIRCGQFNKAVKTGDHCGHWWRGIALQGWMLYDDPNNRSRSGEVQSTVGNPNRDIWKLCAWETSNSLEVAPYWKAIVGVFCGNLKAILPVCKDWEDYLWAYLKVLIDVRVEQELALNGPRSYVHLPDEYWNFKFSLEDIFQELAGNYDSGVRLEAARVERFIQKCLILNQIGELVSLMFDWCSKDETSVHIKRLCAHIAMMMKLVKLTDDSQKINGIVMSYVRVVMRTKNPMLVAFYAKHLPSEDQIQLYSEFLEDIEDNQLRDDCILAAESCKLDIEEIIKRVVCRIREHIDTTIRKLNEEAAPDVTDDDLKKISALEWLTHYPRQRDEALRQCNSLIRTFLLNNKLKAAQMAIQKIPADSVAIVMNKYNVTEKNVHSALLEQPIYQAAVKEHLCFGTYLLAEEAFSNWFYNFHNSCPVEPAALPENAAFSEKVEHDHRLNAYKAALKEWKASVDKYSKDAVAKLYNVLLFPHGWLEEKVYLEEQERIKQLEELRKLLIPKVTLLLHNVLHSCERYDDCLQLTEIIAAEYHQLYKAFSQQSLKDFLKKVAESSVCLLDAGLDSWGFPVTS